MKEKKAEDKENEWKKASRDRTKKKFWDLINKQRRQKTTISDKFSMRDWEQHFKEHFQGTIVSNENVTEISESEDISLEKVKEIIEKTNKRNAAGEEKIPNEA